MPDWQPPRDLDPTDHPAVRRALIDACHAGLEVALVSPSGQVAADHRPGLSREQRIPVAKRRGVAPAELVTSCAQTAGEWFDAALAALGERTYVGNPQPIAIAVRVGADNAKRILSHPGVIAGPTAEFVTLWRTPRPSHRANLRSPEVASYAAVTGAPMPARRPAPKPIVVSATDEDPWDDTLRVWPSVLGTVSDGSTQLQGYWVTGQGEGARYFRVVVAEYGSGRGYARRLDPERWVDPSYSRNDCWVYSKGLSGGQWLDHIRAYGRRLTPADLKRFGALYGRCMRCHQKLTAPSSVARGCGDVCAAHLVVHEPARARAV